MISFTACGQNTSTQFNTDTENPTVGTDAVSESENTSEPAPSAQSQTEDVAGKKVLIAFFSRADENYGVGVVEKGNTEIVAEMIAEETEGDLFHIQTVTPYPVGYDECTEVAKQEQADNARPELNTEIQDFASYDIVYLGYPIWWSDMPMAVYSFLESYDFSGKTVIPFSTHAGSGLAGTVDSIKESCPQATVMDGLAVSGADAQNDQDNRRKQVVEWIRQSK